MITITHGKATFTVKPENTQGVYDLLALIDKSKGRKGRKLPKDKGHAKHNSMSRSYPVLYAGMTTADYVERYHTMNGHLHLAKVKYTHADRPAAMLDPTIPEVVEEACEQ
jgi:hypothetical protein